MKLLIQRKDVSQVSLIKPQKDKVERSYDALNAPKNEQKHMWMSCQLKQTMILVDICDEQVEKCDALCG